MLPLLAVLAQTSSGLAVDYVPFQGLSVRLDGVPIVLGSSFQFYEDGWARGIYSSVWNPAEIDRPNAQTIRVRFQAQADYVSGTHIYTSTADGVKGDFEFEWKGRHPVRLEHTISHLWSPYIEFAPITQDGASGILIGSEVRSGQVSARTIGRPAKVTSFAAPRATVTISTSRPATLYDARGGNQPWATGKEVAWFGLQNMPIRPGEVIRYTVEWKVTPRQLNTPAPAEHWDKDPAVSNRVKRAEAAEIPLIPAPKERADGQGTVVVDGGLRLQGEQASSLQRALDEVLQTRWQSPNSGNPVLVQLKLGAQVPPEGYLLETTTSGAVVWAADAAGLRNGVLTLAGLVHPQGGRLVIPVTRIKDWPSLRWRGVHMFVGPEALNFQSRLMAQVLAPLKFNHVVLQCERTDWSSQPGIRTSQTMARQDLAALVANYRAHGIEPIPLIQSLGHMEWFFANRQNLNFAYNPDIAYTLDARKAPAREAIKSIWREAFTIFKPKVIHIGFDEIGNRGMPNDRYLKTRLWQAMLPELVTMARANNAELMLWGDMMLAPGEANDAMHGDDAENAQARRQGVPPGSFIADWHYENNPNPERFRSLALWKRLGHKPIAATWNQPNNIYGFTHAAIAQGAHGLLQTTWAGYESNERNFISAFPQFAAYLWAAEYAWSGRKERPADLPYDAAAVLKRMYFDGPQPVRDVPGAIWSLGAESREIAGYQFRVGNPVGLVNQLRNDERARPAEIRIPIGRTVRQLNVLLDCQTWLFEGETVGTLLIAKTDGTEVPVPVLYGHDVRMRRDDRPTYRTASAGGLSVVTVPLASADISEVRILASNPNAGMRLHGLSVQ
jgi:hexosaminidase